MGEEGAGNAPGGRENKSQLRRVKDVARERVIWIWESRVWWDRGPSVG